MRRLSPPSCCCCWVDPCAPLRTCSCTVCCTSARYVAFASHRGLNAVRRVSRAHNWLAVASTTAVGHCHSLRLAGTPACWLSLQMRLWSSFCAPQVRSAGVFASLYMSSLLLRENVLALIMAQVPRSAAPGFLDRSTSDACLAGVCAVGPVGRLRGLVDSRVPLGVRLGCCAGACCAVQERTCVA